MEKLEPRQSADSGNKPEKRGGGQSCYTEVPSLPFAKADCLQLSVLHSLHLMSKAKRRLWRQSAFLRPSSKLTV